MYVHPCTPLYTYVHSCIPMYTNIHPCTLMYTNVHHCTLMYTHVHSSTPMYTNVHPCTLMYTYVHQCTPLYTDVHSCTPMHTLVHSCILMYTHIYPHVYPCTLMYTHMHSLQRICILLPYFVHISSVCTMYTSVLCCNLGTLVLYHATSRERDRKTTMGINIYAWLRIYWLYLIIWSFFTHTYGMVTLWLLVIYVAICITIKLLSDTKCDLIM